MHLSLFAMHRNRQCHRLSLALSSVNVRALRGHQPQRLNNSKTLTHQGCGVDALDSEDTRLRVHMATLLKVEERESVSLGAYYIIEQMASVNTWHVHWLCPKGLQYA